MITVSSDHVLEVLGIAPGAEVICHAKRKLQSRILISEYFLAQSGKIISQPNEAVDIPSGLIRLPNNFSILGAENVPIERKTETSYPAGITFATLRKSIGVMMEPFIGKNLSDKPEVVFSEDIVCIATYNVFGHFLLQTCLKLFAIRDLGLLDKVLVVFAGPLPKSYIELIDALGAMPKRHCVLPLECVITSKTNSYVAMSPINTVSTPLCSVLSLGPSCNDRLRLEEGRIKQSPTWINPRRGINASSARMLALATLEYNKTSSSSLSCQQGFKKIYLARKTGSHRAVGNRQEILDYVEHHGYRPVYLEDLPIACQMEILASCSHLIAEVGSTSCNCWLMPNLESVIELSLPSAAIPWGPVLDSATRDLRFIRVLGVEVPGSLKRFDGDPFKLPMPQDSDFLVPISAIRQALEFVAA